VVLGADISSPLNTVKVFWPGLHNWYYQLLKDCKAFCDPANGFTWQFREILIKFWSWP
jgi:hypothetical protein